MQRVDRDVAAIRSLNHEVRPGWMRSGMRATDRGRDSPQRRQGRPDGGLLDQSPSAKNAHRAGSPNQSTTSKETSMLEANRARSSSAPTSQPPRFYSVNEAARMFGISAMTLYRAINAGEFPAVRIRGRLIVPAKAVEAMSDAAMAEQGVVDAAGWVISPAGGAA